MVHEAACWQPAMASHVSVVQLLLSLQSMGFEPTHVPPWQAELCVQTLLSSQGKPSTWFGFEHMPVTGLQRPATWHWSWAMHVTGFMPLHTPVWQVSVCVQASPSLQAELDGRI